MSTSDRLVGQEVTSLASPESNISLERLQRRLSRLAFDVHDGPLQELAALGYELSNLRNKTTRSSSPDPDLDAEFERMMSQLASVEGMLRSMMFAMEEGAAASSDLELVVEQQVDAFRALSPKIDVDVSAEGDLGLHTDSQRILVDRVLRESLSNVARHSAASRVSIQLRGYSDALLIRVQDNGRGFDPQARAQGPWRPPRRPEDDAGAAGPDRRDAEHRQPAGRPDHHHRRDRQVASWPHGRAGRSEVVGRQRPAASSRSRGIARPSPAASKTYGVAFATSWIGPSSSSEPRAALTA